MGLMRRSVTAEGSTWADEVFLTLEKPWGGVRREDDSPRAWRVRPGCREAVLRLLSGLAVEERGFRERDGLDLTEADRVRGGGDGGLIEAGLEKLFVADMGMDLGVSWRNREASLAVDSRPWMGSGQVLAIRLLAEEMLAEAALSGAKSALGLSDEDFDELPVAPSRTSLLGASIPLWEKACAAMDEKEMMEAASAAGASNENTARRRI